MSLGKLTQDDIIENALKKEFQDKFSIEFPIVFIENKDFLFHLKIQTSNLGRTLISQPGISFKKINSIVNPILDKYQIVYSKWSQSFTYPKKWDEDLSYLHSDSKKEINDVVEKLILYINKFCIPFWDKYQDTKEVLNLINENSEKDLNQGIFQGVKGIMSRLTIAHNEGSDYYCSKKEFYLELIKSYSEKKPEQYNDLYLAYKELIEFLDSKTI